MSEYCSRFIIFLFNRRIIRVKLSFLNISDGYQWRWLTAILIFVWQVKSFEEDVQDISDKNLQCAESCLFSGIDKLLPSNVPFPWKHSRVELPRSSIRVSPILSSFLSTTSSILIENFRSYSRNTRSRDDIIVSCNFCRMRNRNRGERDSFHATDATMGTSNHHTLLVTFQTITLTSNDAPCRDKIFLRNREAYYTFIGLILRVKCKRNNNVLF